MEREQELVCQIYQQIVSKMETQQLQINTIEMKKQSNLKDSVSQNTKQVNPDMFL